MFKDRNIKQRDKRIKNHLSALLEGGYVGIADSGFFGIYQEPFIKYLLEAVIVEDIEDLVDAVIALVEEKRMKKSIEEQYMNSIRKKISSLVVEH